MQRTKPKPQIEAIAIAMSAAETVCARAHERFTPARRTAYRELLAQPQPLTAYELLAKLEDRLQRKLSPLTVYRALEFLTRTGLVHKLESRHSFVACKHPQHPHQGLYLVCSACGRADEMHADEVARAVQRAAQGRGFRPRRQIVEVQGVCRDCGADGD